MIADKRTSTVAPYSAAKWAATMNRGCRGLLAELLVPGELHRNSYARAWFVVDEKQPWSGYLGRVMCYRRLTVNGPRETFTGPAASKVNDEWPPVMAARGGFGALWMVTHQAQTKRPTPEVDTARDALDWLNRQSQVVDMWATGQLIISPCQNTNNGAVRSSGFPSQNHFSPDRAKPAARLLLDGNQVGWLTEHGEIVPLEKGYVA